MHPLFISKELHRMPTAQLSEAIVGILRREGADNTMILGARLGALVREEHPALLLEEMHQRAMKFVQLVEEIPEVRVVRDPSAGLDVLIGLQGSAPPPVRGESSFIRRDVFVAFTKAGVQHSYDPEADEFHEGPPREGGAECPQVRLTDPAEMRAEFASTVPDPDGSELRSALDSQAGSLTRFRETMLRLGRTSGWEQFRYEALTERIRGWATDRGIDVSPAWFRRTDSLQRRLGPKELLGDIARVMTDAEAREVLVSVGAIERYLSRRRRGSLS